MNQRSAQRVPVLVVGGSLVGLSLSVFLGRLGVPHSVVERHARTSHHPRGRGNNLRTMELFRVAGLEDDIREAASVLRDNHGILQADTLSGSEQEWLFRQIDPGGRTAAFSPASWCLCSQNDLEPVLLRHAEALSGSVRFGTELVSFEQDRDGVTAELLDRATGQRSTLTADYLVAADGPRSPVRERLGIGQSGPGDLFHNVSVTFRAPQLADVVGDRLFIACYLTAPDGAGALLPVDNRERWVFHIPWHPEQGESIEEFTDERCAAHIRAAAGIPDLDVEITGRAPWHAAERVADSYHAGRVFLAGDSAHEMPPTGAFGSNTGIQDAHNLAWKLAAVLAGWAGPGLLETYGAERRPVAVETASRAALRSAEHRHPGFDVPGGPGPGGPGPGAGAGSGPGSGRPGSGRPGFGPGAGSGRPGSGPGGSSLLPVALGYRYTAGAIVGADPYAPTVPDDFAPTGEPGTRAPHLWLNRAGAKISTIDLFERFPVLLTAQDSPWQAAAAAAAAETWVPLECQTFGPEDSDIGWQKAYGIGPDGAVLVRPDGFVAWRSPGSARDAEAELRNVLREVLSLDES